MSVAQSCPTLCDPMDCSSQATLSITSSQSLFKLISIESVMPSSHLILCHPLLLLPPIPPSIKVFSNESTLRIRWPKYWSFSFSIIPSKEHPGLISLCSIKVAAVVSSLLLFSSSVVSSYLRPHGLQHAWFPCPLLSPGVCSNSSPLNQ